MAAVENKTGLMEVYKNPKWFFAHTIITLKECGSKEESYLVNAKTYAEVERRVTEKSLSSGTCTFFLIENIRQFVLCENLLNRETEATKNFLCEYYLINEELILAGFPPFQGNVYINADDEEQAKNKAQIFCKHRYKSAQAEIGHIEELTEIIE